MIGLVVILFLTCFSGCEKGSKILGGGGTDEDFEKTIADYLTFEVNMITHGRGYLFGIEEKTAQIEDDVLKVAEDGADYV